MRAIDTNIAARYILQDDPQQYRAAFEVMQGPVFIPVTVLLELGWLLGKRFGQPRAVVHATLARLIDLPSVEVANPELILWALERYAAGADFADMIHVAMSGPAESFVTFDKAMVSDAGPDSPVRVEVLR